MEFSCNKVGMDFVESAPERIVNEIELEASPERVFEVLENGDAWPRWFDDILKVEWTSPKPFGVGTTRIVTLKPMTVYEEFIAWETGKRFTFCFTGTSLPFMKALCEDYRLEPLGKNRTKFTYIVAYDPHLHIELAGPIGKWALGNMFQNATHSLANFMLKIG